MQVPVHTLDGDTDGEIDLPAVFDSEFRPDLIRRAVLAAQANRKQDYGADEYAGLRTPAESFGSGRGQAHVPREGGQARRVPQTVGGRPAHPPKAEKDRSFDMNDKARRKAIRSAIAATTDAEVVRERGHEFDDDVELPLVVSDEFEDLTKTQDAADTLESLGIDADIERADKTKIRAGQGKTRGRKYTRPKSILFVTSETESRAARNLAGADVTTATELDAEDLAPGTDAGRLTVWTESAVEEVADR
ncbi:large subunit ribosomal protein L4e [Halovenus aranensis]|jgi:large subunit ribosomal protein L4e|uniref:Large ribosomal subunit protein uL4 n=1 Tax=Halovenus aranensis TaxID=890420 RepID=A0A1G8UF57_9EURY|nr:50S ribosomal protein L4 [Halovenus aranensis]SDJ52234.1 large subunit ribosomal protein L4e [Halovenus aranensis]